VRDVALVARVLEELAGECMAFAFSLVVHNNLAGNIAANGNDDQKARYLPTMLSGERIGAFLLTEPGAGSDAAGITTAARRDGDGWVIEGEKAWVTNGTTAETLSAYVQTDASAGWRGIACVMVDAEAPGVERLPAYPLLGTHGLGTNGFRFSGCRVADADVLLAAGDGFKAAMNGINLARALLSACCIGMFGASLRAAIDYAAERRAFGQSTLDFQGMEWNLTDVATDLEAARRLTDHAVDVMDAGSDGVVEAAHAKKFATRAAFNGIAACMQAMGARGLHHDHVLARHLSSAKAAQYMDGSTEIQNLVLGRNLRTRYGSDS
jgi:alkylation response protein AidB-like acyl-CoA dehydrogenase